MILLPQSVCDAIVTNSERMNVAPSLPMMASEAALGFASNLESKARWDEAQQGGICPHGDTCTDKLPPDPLQGRYARLYCGEPRRLPVALDCRLNGGCDGFGSFARLLLSSREFFPECAEILL